MKDRYAGDIGDFGKLALLQSLEKQGMSIGVNWYKTEALHSDMYPDGTYKQNDGKHRIPDDLRICDQNLADALIHISKSEDIPRNLRSIQEAHLLKTEVFYDAVVPVNSRDQWHRNALSFFLDIM